MKFGKITASALCVFALFVLLLIPAFSLFQRGLSGVVAFDGDALINLSLAKAMIDHGGWWFNPDLSFPFGLATVAFPVNGVLDFLFLRFFCLFTTSPFVALNLYFYASIFFAWAGAFLSLRILGFRFWLAFAIGMLFAFLPHVYFRNISHLMLVHDLVPFACAAALLVLRPDDLVPSRTRSGLVLAYFALGLQYTYTAFFSCFFVCIAWCAGWIAGFSAPRERLKWVVSMVLACIVGQCLSLGPALWAWHKDPAAAKNIAGLKMPVESEMYGLKLRQLFLPDSHNLYPPLAKLGAKFDEIAFPLENENHFSRLGVAGGVGFIYLIFCLTQNLFTGDVRTSLARSAGFLFLTSFLWATIGGLGAIFNTLVTPQIRAYNRISVFMGFFCLVGFGIFLEKVVVRRLSERWVPFVMLAVVVLGVSEQWQPSGSIDAISLEMRDVREFVGRIETLRPQQRLYQLPYRDYPNNSEAYLGMQSMEHFKPYLYSHDIKWAWPAMGREAIEFNVELQKKTVPEQIEILKKRGFTGFWINARGYTDTGKALIGQLSMVTHHEPIQSRDGKYSYISILD